MGRELLAQEPIFRELLEQCDGLLRQHADWSLLHELAAEAPQSRLAQTAIAQPALFALQVGLAALWRSWGIVPDAVVGHSVGEVAAAQISGVLSLDDAIRVVFHRGRLMQQATGQGKMAAVELAWEEAERVLVGYEERLALAALNSPTSVVLSGDEAALTEVLHTLAQRGITHRMLQVDYAFHSPQMEPCLSALQEALADLVPQPAAIPIFSTVTGRRHDRQGFDAAYWGRNIREPVRFATAIEGCKEAGHTVFVELSPHPVLGASIAQCLSQRHQQGTILASLRRGQGERRTLLAALGALYAQGSHVNWPQLFPLGGRCVPLPPYPWQRERFWLAAPRPGKNTVLPPRSTTDTPLHPLVGQRLRSPLLQDMVFESHLSTEVLPFLADHRVFGHVVFPATAHLEIALAAATQALAPGRYVLENMVLHEPLFLPEGKERTVQAILTSEDVGTVVFKLFSLRAGEDNEPTAWKQQATGDLHIRQNEAVVSLPVSLAEAQTHCPEAVSVEAYYQQLRARGLEYGPSFQGLAQLWRGHGAALGRIRLAETLLSAVRDYQIHPVLLDACLQVLMSAWDSTGEQALEGALYLPLSVQRFQVYGCPGTHAWSYATIRPLEKAHQETLVGDVYVWDDAGQVVATVEGLCAKRTSRQALLRTTHEQYGHWLYEVAWQPKAREGVEQAVEPQPGQRGSWLIFADTGGVGVALASRLHEHGESCVLVFPGEAYERSPASHWRIDPTSPTAFQRLLTDTLRPDCPPWRGVVHLWSLEAAPPEETTGASLQAAQRLGCGSVLHLVQALAAMGSSPRPRLWLVTRGAQPVGSEPGPLAVAQAPLWGLGRTIVLEYPDLRCTRIDLAPSSEEDDTHALFAEVWAPDAEDQVAFRHGVRCVPRLRHAVARVAPPAKNTLGTRAQPVRLAIAARGVFDHLHLQPMARRGPGPGEVEIRVYTTGLNFRDVLNALGMYPGDPGPLGLECAGEIVALGEGVEHVHMGERVLALAPASFSTFVTTAAAYVVPKPDALSFAEAATIPITFLTAAYALHHLAHIAAGERVLIHAAAGGVGMAAVQLAQRAGAEIFGTAGSPEKRAFLQALGVHHVMDSRSLTFAQEVRACTGGQGVDIVLNSLAGVFIPASVAVLGAQGRFVEIGKRDIWTPEQVAQTRQDVAYWALDLGEVMRQEPALLQSMLYELLEAFTEGTLTPLPHRVFALQEAAQAFRYMAQAKHIGKVVVAQSDPGPEEASEALTSVRADGTYLVTGGLGGLGLCVARWMVAQGARHLVLMGRNPASRAAQAVITELEQQGAQVLVTHGDVSRAEDVASVLEHIGQAPYTLRGLIHAAGVLDDGILLQQEWARFDKVMAPKLAGAWNLHVLTQGVSLDFFVLFSSMAALLGSPGQGNYAAANAFLDALAHHRRTQSLPALSINWGPWAEVGMAAALGRPAVQRWREQGIEPIAPEHGVEVLGQVLAQGATQVGVLPIAWATYAQQWAPGGAPPFLAHLAHGAKSREHSEPPWAPRPTLVQHLEGVPVAERYGLLARHIRDQAAKVLGLGGDASHHLDPQRPLHELGLDSVMAVELTNALGLTMGRHLPATLLFDCPTIAALAEYLAEEVLSLESPPESRMDSQQVEDEKANLVERIEQLSEEEVDSLFEKFLKKDE